MKVFIDILTPKQCMLFSKLAEHLRKKGDEVFEATREYREVNQLLEMKGIRARVVGKHGGQNLQDKLEASAERTLELASIVGELEPDVAVSLSSPETSRVAFGLGIPHVCLNDSPHSEAVAKLTVPLATILLTPEVILKSVWTKFGIQPEKIIQYHALDVWGWLKDFKPDRKILNKLGLEKSKPIVVFRVEESFASYLLGKTSKTSILLPMIENLLKSKVDFQPVIVPRYESQVSLLKEKFKKRAIILESVVDSPSLLSYTSVFVGAGGTMTAEAALLGVPTISCYPDKSFLIEKYLISKGLVIRETSPQRVRTKVLNLLRDGERLRRVQKLRAQALTRSFEDPVEAIMKAIDRVT